jgi:P-type Ca2+ transporter type 2C
MKRPPRHSQEPILGRPEWSAIAFTAVLQTIATLGIFTWALQSRDLVEARNLAFTVIVFGELFRSFASRSTQRLFWEVGVFSNLTLLAVVTVSVLAQLAMHHIPAMEDLFQIGQLSLADCALSLLVGLLPVSVIETSKLVRRRLHRGVAIPA